MRKDDCYLLGYILRTHGVHGEVRVVLDADNPARYKKLESVLIELNHELIPFLINRISIKDNQALVSFKEIDTKDKADALVKSSLFVPLSSLPILPDEKIYLHDLVGYKVIDATEGDLGVINEVVEFPQQLIAKMIFQEKEVLFPLTPTILTKIDKTARSLLVQLPDGLLDVYLG